MKIVITPPKEKPDVLTFPILAKNINNNSTRELIVLFTGSTEGIKLVDSDELDFFPTFNIVSFSNIRDSNIWQIFPKGTNINIEV